MKPISVDTTTHQQLEVGRSPSTRLRLLGTVIDPLTCEEWLEYLATLITEGCSGVLLGHHNLHSLYMCHSDQRVSEFYERCESVYVDGKPVLWLARLVQPGLGSDRAFSLMCAFNRLLERAQDKSWRVFFLGGQPDVARAASEQVQQKFPKLSFAFHHGFFDDSGPESQQVLERIQSFRPNLLIVGMGMPRQEHWLLRHIDLLDVQVAINTGASMDYVVGAQARPPQWMWEYGLAWLYRLCHNPRRLWRRYLVEPWVLVPGATTLVWRRLRNGSADTGRDRS